MVRLSILLILLGLFGVLGVGCSSSPEPVGDPSSESSILEPVANDAPQETPADNDAARELPPAYHQLIEVLSQRGYQGVGLQFEPPEVLHFLHEVFSDPATAGLAIQLVYTGMELSYDARHQSLTVGGPRDKAKVLDFMRKRIPKRPAETAAPPDAPKGSPEPSL